MAQARTKQEVVGPNPWDNPANYRSCRKKFYEIFACFPPLNTVVVNKLEQADVVKQLGGRTYFTAEEISKMPKNNLALLQQLVKQGRAYAVTEQQRVVLCGTVGELWCISVDKLVKGYTFVQDGKPIQINDQSISARFRRWDKERVCDWQPVRVSEEAVKGSETMACFVPANVQGQIQTSYGAVLNINGVDVPHGKGDFVVCTKLPNGKPDLYDRWVVNGEVFGTTYNNRGFSEFIGKPSVTVTRTKLPKLVADIALGSLESVHELIRSRFSEAIRQSRNWCTEDMGSVTFEPAGLGEPWEKSALEFVKDKFEASDETVCLCRFKADTGDVCAVWDVFHCAVFLLGGKNYERSQLFMVFPQTKHYDYADDIAFLGGFHERNRLALAYQMADSNADDIALLRRVMAEPDLDKVLWGSSQQDFKLWNDVRQVYNMMCDRQLNGITVYAPDLSNLPGQPEVGRGYSIEKFTEWSLSPEGNKVGLILDTYIVSVRGMFVTERGSGNPMRVVLAPIYNLRIKGVEKFSDGREFYLCGLSTNNGNQAALDKKFKVEEKMTKESVLNTLHEFMSKSQAIASNFQVVKGKDFVMAYPNSVTAGHSWGESCEGSFGVRVIGRGTISSVYISSHPRGKQRTGETIEFESLRFVEKLLLEAAVKLTPSSDDSLFDTGKKLVFDVTKLLLNDGYKVLGQQIPEPPDKGKLQTFTGVISAQGGSDTPMQLQIQVDRNLRVSARGRSGNSVVDTSFDGRNHNAAGSIFKAVREKLSADQYKRAEQALTIVARYKGISFKANIGDTGAHTYGVGEKISCLVSVDGKTMVFSKLRTSETLTVACSERLEEIARKLAKWL